MPLSDALLVDNVCGGGSGGGRGGEGREGGRELEV